MQIADRLANIPFSGIRKILEAVDELERGGWEIIRLEIGRPDFDTPAHIKAAAVDALAAGKVHSASRPLPTSIPRLFTSFLQLGKM